MIESTLHAPKHPILNAKLYDGENILELVTFFDFPAKDMKLTTHFQGDYKYLVVKIPDEEIKINVGEYVCKTEYSNLGYDEYFTIPKDIFERLYFKSELDPTPF